MRIETDIDTSEIDLEYHELIEIVIDKFDIDTLIQELKGKEEKSHWDKEYDSILEELKEKGFNPYEVRISLGL